MKIRIGDDKMYRLDSFKNDKYLLLKLLYDSQIKVKDNVYITLTQQELADILHFSKVKTNKMMKELREEHFIEDYQGKRGKYVLSKQGSEVIKIFEKEYI